MLGGHEPTWACANRISKTLQFVAALSGDRQNRSLRLVMFLVLIEIPCRQYYAFGMSQIRARSATVSGVLLTSRTAEAWKIEHGLPDQEQAVSN